MNTQELTINEVKAMYFDEDALFLSPVKLYRYQFKGDRYYFYRALGILDDKGEMTYKPLRLAAGVTTITRRTMPTDDQLIKWIAEMGYEAAMEYRDERAAYGSLMHTCAAELLINKRFDLDLLAEVVPNYCAKNKLRVNEGAWIEDLKQDILALAQFIIDYEVKPLAIELSLVSERLNFGGTLDLLCELSVEESGFFGEVYKSGERKGQPKISTVKVRCNAIVDFKSGRKSNGSKHNAAQLVLQRILLNENYPEFAASQMKLFNFHPKDWRTNPSYTLVDQSESTFALSQYGGADLVNNYKYYDAEPAERTVMKLQGIVDLSAGLQANYTVRNIVEVVEEKIQAGEAPLMHYDMIDDYINRVDDGD